VSVSEELPNGSGSSRRAWLIGRCALTILAIVGSSPLATAQESAEAKALERPGWARTIVVSERHAEDGFFQTAFSQLSAVGLDPIQEGQILGAVNRYVEAEIEAGRSVTLCLGLVLDTLTAASEAHWTPEETGRLLLAFQRQLDGDKRLSLTSLQDAIGRIRPGVTVEMVLAKNAGR